ncbi:hypothetical protein L914_05183 [Phytophthora nicotianae]|uniref:Uncharacterized protein n=2 Tax=Phytophthora nicotianae TaxID=4792 RepID=V9FI51_PHYNI|nr:hypothetical protein F443_05369 [Phytophthora nicotianae P1569]ETM50860.1 hypothetical protein L914_05183 [Phytophthora nicotianae]
MYRNRLNNIRNPGIYWIHLSMYTYLSFMVDHVPEYERRPDGGGPADAAVLRVDVPGVHVGDT